MKKKFTARTDQRKNEQRPAPLQKSNEPFEPTGENRAGGEMVGEKVTGEDRRDWAILDVQQFLAKEHKVDLFGLKWIVRLFALGPELLVFLNSRAVAEK